MNKEDFQSFFSFRKSQRIALATLSAILLVIISLTLLLPLLFKGPEANTIENLKFLEDNQQIAEAEKNKFTNKQYKVSKPSRIKPFHFDPNKMKVSDWTRMGFTEKQAQSINKFRKLIGGFKNAEDLKKVYIISDSDYLMLQPYINIVLESEQKPQIKESTDKVWDKQKFVVEINSADTTAFKTLYGIGSKLSKRIVKYRSLIGGFYSKEQLLEVYGVDEERFMGFEPMIRIDTTNFRKVDILKADFKELIKHPYIDKSLTKEILAYRNNHFQINRESMISELRFPQKLLPYIE